MSRKLGHRRHGHNKTKPWHIASLQEGDMDYFNPPSGRRYVMVLLCPCLLCPSFLLKLFNIRQGDGSIEEYTRHFWKVARRATTEKTCLLVFFWNGLAHPFKSRMPYWNPEESLEDYFNLALHLSGSDFWVELAAEPALFREPTESAPDSAPFREPTESAPEPAPFREPTESSPDSAPFREHTESSPEPAPFREPTESAPESTPFREPTESVLFRKNPQSPVRSGSPQSLLLPCLPRPGLLLCLPHPGTLGCLCLQALFHYMGLAPHPAPYSAPPILPFPFLDTWERLEAVPLRGGYVIMSRPGVPPSHHQRSHLPSSWTHFPKLLTPVTHHTLSCSPSSLSLYSILTHHSAWLNYMYYCVICI